MRLLQLPEEMSLFGLIRDVKLHPLFFLEELAAVVKIWVPVTIC